MSERPDGYVPVSELLSYMERDRYLTLQEAAAYLSISERSIRERLDEIPHFRPLEGRKLLFKRSELDGWMEGFRVNEVDVDNVVDGVLADVLGAVK